ncbi:aminoacyl-tRNA hydrolase [Clostridium sp. CM028]|uniref:aminoacyl-tRNA hydrolase n=1 Tax=Clostridium TaxID=1485 RepID=UPI0013EE73D8|nr:MULTISPECIES: aminoacyl-tRNA hydrolase [Clostridium]MBU3093066.1 aminoacyl-tRNA hydrolase [Clostridium sp. CF011]MBW9145046.1 aminoacyl-tRNA hydrolase [Clostridium sp. CM027]MBW9148544.1 aminoacyl-tRNA hydrolase [Clostridium sp. CM028]MBZ9609585.1 aminoacyl-tRNA hydrolase [Clostridium estertheticum]UVE40177.1 aminoacyl-tRNA hydrolase [Clostridium sp. CM027]
MYLVVGLGNPGNEYRYTRHNVGFDVINLMAEKYNTSINRIKFKGVCGEIIISGEKVILLKPSTYMNLSGESVREAASFYKIPNENIIIMYDDISLDAGKLRIRSKGSAGGHNGIKSIIANMSSDIFLRIKIGVGQPEKALIPHVLGRFSKEDRVLVEKTFEASIKAVQTIIAKGYTEAMNQFNGFNA